MKIDFPFLFWLSNLNHMKNKLIITIIILLGIIIIGINIYPVKDWDKTLNNEGFWYFIRIFATIIGTGLGAFSAYLVAEHSFEKNQKQKKEEIKNRKDLIKKKFIYGSVYTVGNIINLIEELENFPLNFIHHENEDYAVYEIYPFFQDIPTDLIVGIPETELFEILIIDADIQNNSIILIYNDFYSKLLLLKGLSERLKYINRRMESNHEDFFNSSLLNFLEYFKKLDKDKLIEETIDFEEFSNLITYKGFTEKEYFMLDILFTESIEKITHEETKFSAEAKLTKFKKSYEEYLEEFRINLTKIKKIENELRSFIYDFYNLFEVCFDTKTLIKFNNDITANFNKNLESFINDEKAKRAPKQDEKKFK